jgi:glucans biosynthesis protein C
VHYCCCTHNEEYPMSKTQRIHGLDALRAIMMLLGLLLHTALTYGPIDLSVWPLRDPRNTHSFFATTVEFIHVFRMPIFFVVAGFFAALLFCERGPRSMLINRIRRILLPFVIFLPILCKLSIPAFVYSQNQANPNNSARAWAILTDGNFLPKGTIHLWFLYYLIIFSLLSWALASVLQKGPTIARALRAAFSLPHHFPPLALCVFATLSFVCLYIMGSTFAITSMTFRPNAAVFLFYAVFYFYGWALYKEQHFLQSFIQNGWIFFALGALLFALRKMLGYPADDSSLFYLSMAFNALAIWSFVFGISGLFLRYAARPSARMRYLSDASYWIYLVHLPIAAFLPGLFMGFDLSPFLKCAAVLMLTSLISTLSYHYLVRATFVGQFLNGRKYAIGKGALPASTIHRTPLESA